MKPLVIVGASGHGKVVADIACDLGYTDIRFLDDDSTVAECAGFPVVGNFVSVADMDGSSEFFVAIGDASTRVGMLVDIRRRGLPIATLVSPQAYVSRQATVAIGSAVMPGVVINASAEVGEGCIVNTGATVDHDCVIGDYAHVSIGSHIAGGVEIGRGTWIGAGAVVSNNLRICDGCMIGAGAVVIRDIDAPGTYVGVPAKRLSDNRENTTRGGVAPRFFFVLCPSSRKAA